MMFDYCCGSGAFPFRHVDDADVEGLLRLLDGEGIDMALVSAFEAILYRNVQAANEQLARRIEKRRERLIGAATINPLYAEAAGDAALCLREMGMKALRLLPGFHDYDLTDEAISPVLDVAEEAGASVSVVMRVEDERQRHSLFRPRPIHIGHLAQMLRGHPRARFVLERPSTREVLDLVEAAPEQRNWSIEISGRFLFLREPIGERGNVLDSLGPERLLFGSDAPLQYPRAAVLKLEDLNLSPSALRQVQCQNAQNLLHKDA